MNKKIVLGKRLKALIILLSVLFVLVTGYFISPYRICLITSGSMEPDIPTNSIFIVDKSVPFESIEKGDYIRFKSDIAADPVMHQVYQINEVQGQKSILTKGINNSFLDKGRITEENYMGRYVMTITVFKPIVDLVLGDMVVQTQEEILLRFIILMGIFIVITVILVIFINKHTGKKENK